MNALTQVSMGATRSVSMVDSFHRRRHDWGLRRTLYWYLMHALAKVGFHLNYVSVGSDLPEIMRDRERPDVPEGYETRVVDLTEMRQYAGTVPDLSLDFLDAAAARGDECTANFYRGELVGFGFSSHSRTRATPQIDVLIPAGFRYGYKAWTHPDHRRYNLSRMRGYVRRQSRRYNPAERSIAYVETHNYASLLHSYRVPKERRLWMGFTGWCTILGRQIPFNSRRAKWIGFEFVRKEDPAPRQYV